MSAITRPAGLGPHQCIWTDAEGQPWFVGARLARVGERMEVVGMDVRSVRLDEEVWLAGHLPASDEGNAARLSSMTWRSLGALASELRHSYVTALRESGMLDQSGNERARAAWLAPKDRILTRHEEVADVYKAAEQSGMSTTEAVAEHFSISSSAASKRVQRAREAGFLPQTNRGRPRKSEADLN